MSNYPEGVTDKTIDDHFGGGRDDWPYLLECDHSSELDALYERLDGEGIEDPESDPAFLALLHSPTQFDDKTAEVRSWATTWGAECEWICPVCGHVNSDTVDKGDM